MSDNESVTQWIERIARGDEGEPQTRLVDRFLDRLTALARTKLNGLRGDEDESDVALSALKSYLMRAPKAEFKQVTDRDSLWALLAAITLHKSLSARRRQLAQKRDVRRVESLEELIQQGPSDAFLASVFDEGNRLLESLPEETMKEVARLRMEGYSNEDISDRIGRSVKTVERKLRMIRHHLRSEFNNDG